MKLIEFYEDGARKLNAYELGTFNTIPRVGDSVRIESGKGLAKYRVDHISFDYLTDRIICFCSKW